MAPTPSPRTLQSYQTTPSKTPQLKHRIHLPTPKNSGNPLSITPTEHPVEVVGRIRDYPDHKDKSCTAALEISGDGRFLRVRSDAGYRDFSLDGVSLSENENLDRFYERFVESRVEGVRSGAKCTIMMYGPTGSGKSHTMFGCGSQPGIVYRALRDILGEGGRDAGVDDAGFGLTLFVQATVLEIYNEEIYDLLSGGNTNCAAGSVVSLPKGSMPKARLEVMGRKAKNATYITGNEAGKISREVAKVEKRRIVKSTLCNERSSRSHCLIILDVPSVGGRLMLVDMAGSENIEQAGQPGFEAKMQTAKINQGNIALKRVVESIANGDSHVPFRDSKLTMLLQDSFEDDKSKILMILCASPDPKERHKTVATLEYGAKAKCIIRVAHMPTPRDKLKFEDSSPLLRSRIVAMNQFIYKLQMENKMKEKECEKAQRELILKEEEILQLRSNLALIEGRGTAAREDDVRCLVDERTRSLRIELKKMEELMNHQEEELDILRQQLEEMESSKCAANENVLHQQQEELNFLRKQLVEMESSKCTSNADVLNDVGGENFLKRLYMGDQTMEKSMELDMGDQPPIHFSNGEINGVKEIKEDMHYSRINFSSSEQINLKENVDFGIPRFPDKVCLSTVFEMEDEGEDREGMNDKDEDREGMNDKDEDREGMEEGEVEKEVVEDGIGHRRIIDYEIFPCSPEHHLDSLPEVDYVKDPASARKTRIQNIFRLCGNHRELAQQVKISTPQKRRLEDADMSSLAVRKESATKGNHSAEFALPKLSDNFMKASESVASSLPPSICMIDSKQEFKENKKPEGAEAAGMMDDVYVKWETSKGFSGNLIKKLKVLRNSTLSDLRKTIEAGLKEEGNNNQSFIFLLLSDPMGTVLKDKEAAVSVNMLPVCSNQPNSYLACLRPTKSTIQWQNHIPFSSLENALPLDELKT